VSTKTASETGGEPAGAREITDTGGTTRAIGCLSCAIATRAVPVRGGSVIRSAHFDVHQDFEIPIPGFLILTSLRHLQSVADFDDEEAGDFMAVLRKARALQRDVLGIGTVYLHQEEDTSHHFHLWLFPRHDWMSAFGRKAPAMTPIMEHARTALRSKAQLGALDEAVAALRAEAQRPTSA